MHLGRITALAGAEKTLRWANMGVHSSAPTPVNFQTKEDRFKDSVYVLDESQCECYVL